MFERLINSLFGTKDNTVNINIKIENLDKIVEVLSKLANRPIIDNKNDNKSNSSADLQKNQSIINNTNNESKKKHLEEDPITATDIANLMSSTGIKKGIDKTGEITSQSEGLSVDNQLSSLKRIKGKGN